jgi:hypothetical protein
MSGEVPNTVGGEGGVETIVNVREQGVHADGPNDERALDGKLDAGEASILVLEA